MMKPNDEDENDEDVRVMRPGRGVVCEAVRV